MHVCFVFSNRSEYSELKPFIDFFKKKAKVDVVDLSKKIKKLEFDKNLHKIFTYCYEIFSKKKFDYVVILGDRKELPFIALPAFFLDIKIIHLAAGEYIESVTNYDQFIRPIISILSDYQVCFSKRAKQQVKKLFSSINYLHDNAYFIGNPVFSDVKIKQLKRCITEDYDLVLLHPQSMSKDDTLSDVKKLKKLLKNKKTIFISGNRDKNYSIIENFYKKLKSQKNSYSFYKTLPKEKYFSFVKYCDNFFTNTSSIHEIQFLNKKCLKVIGQRNKGRSNEKFNINAPKELYFIMQGKRM